MWSIINIKTRLFQSFLHLFKATFWCWYFTSKSATDIEFNFYSFTCQQSYNQPVLSLVHKISFKSCIRYQKRIHSAWIKMAELNLNHSVRMENTNKWLTLESIMAEQFDTHFLFFLIFAHIYFQHIQQNKHTIIRWSTLQRLMAEQFDAPFFILICVIFSPNTCDYK